MEIAINYWAVLAAAVANMAIGALWYGPVFGKYWMKMMGFTPESMKSMPLSSMQAMAGGLVTALLMAYVLAHVGAVFGILGENLGYGAQGLAEAFQLAFFMWLGFVATTQAGSYLWEGKCFKLFLFNAAESFLALFAMASIIVFWK